jgi:hypothetical protein
VRQEREAWPTSPPPSGTCASGSTRRSLSPTGGEVLLQVKRHRSTARRCARPPIARRLRRSPRPVGTPLS